VEVVEAEEAEGGVGASRDGVGAVLGVECFDLAVGEAVVSGGEEGEVDGDEGGWVGRMVLA
jgi:hypothetical protein